MTTPTTGICTLANDHVFDQVIALINSICEVMGADFPICIFPYDNCCDRLQSAICDRPNVTIFQDIAMLDYWDKEAKRVWDACPSAKLRWAEIIEDPYYRFGTHRRFGAFSGPFDRFLYMDADTVLLQDVTPILKQLDTHDWIVYDFQHRDVSHVYNCASDQLLQVFTPHQINHKIFCSGFYAAKRGTFSQTQLDDCLRLLQAGEHDLLYCMAPDQTVLNYWVMRSNLAVYNYALELPGLEVTGCCVTSDHFEVKGSQISDRGNPLTYLHYIGLSSSLFAQLCEGENIDFPYREVFLHYRYLHDPSSRPVLPGKARPHNKRSFTDRILTKLRLPR
ncbi:MAG: sugar transferase [Alkalinema sp. FL-bin-369]|nr:sugar transferase [Leptolyngbyaceae cyanobacterium LF-bin-369]